MKNDKRHLIETPAIFAFPALQFVCASLMLFVMFRMWQDPQVSQHLIFAASLSLIDLGLSLFIVDRGLWMIRDIKKQRKTIKTLRGEQE